MKKRMQRCDLVNLNVVHIADLTVLHIVRSLTSCTQLDHAHLATKIYAKISTRIHHFSLKEGFRRPLQKLPLSRFNAMAVIDAIQDHHVITSVIIVPTILADLVAASASISHFFLRDINSGFQVRSYINKRLLSLDICTIDAR